MSHVHNVAMSQSNDLLSLRDIETELGVSYARLRAIVGAPGVSKYLGARDLAGVKGDRYDRSSLPVWQRIVEALDGGIVTPKTLGAFLSATRNSLATGDDPQSRDTQLELPGMPLVPKLPGMQLVPAAVNNMTTMSTDRDDAMIEALRAIANVMQPPPDDELLNRERAAELLCCTQRSVSRYVKPAREGSHPAWRRSDLLRYIAQL